MIAAAETTAPDCRHSNWARGRSSRSPPSYRLGICATCSSRCTAPIPGYTIRNTGFFVRSFACSGGWGGGAGGGGGGGGENGSHASNTMRHTAKSVGAGCCQHYASKGTRALRWRRGAAFALLPVANRSAKKGRIRNLPQVDTCKERASRCKQRTTQSRDVSTHRLLP